ncbi:MAG: 4Fe-4S dicluster domain-containing protein [Candidatus Diapherotrites archaeon]
MQFILPKKDLGKYLEEIGKRKGAELFAPLMKQGGSTSFGKLSEGELFLESNTTFSPKKFFIPHREDLFEFDLKKNSVGIKDLIDKKKRIVFGIRPCDLNAVKYLDHLLLEFFGKDNFYGERRKNSYLIGLECTRAGKNCFCTSLGTNTAENYDMLFVPLGKNYWIDVKGKGEDLISRLFRKTSSLKPKIKLNCKKKVNTKDIAELTDKKFDHKIWEKMGERCLSCAQCTASCPTCNCFLITESIPFGKSKSLRGRELDYCHLPRFTEVAGNHVFRRERSSRLRQFILHKFNYTLQDHGMISCIGCGRCISECPVGIDLTEILGEIRGK